MSRHKEFDFENLPRASKDIYELRMKAPDLTGLAGAVRTTCGDTITPDAISDAIAARLDGESLSIPVLAVKGASGQGKTLVATAGVHGDEYEGMEAIYRTYEALDPSNLSGTFVAVPVVTLPAFWQATRANPVDGLNMARIFPGSPSGSMSERLAALMLEKVFRHADLYIDLHSSGRNNAMMTLVGYASLGRQAETARSQGCTCVLIAPQADGPDSLDGVLAPQLLAGLDGFELVAYWADDELARAYRRALAARQGPILPLVTGRNLADYCLLERHICTDTTATGGNAALLASLA